MENNTPSSAHTKGTWEILAKIGPDGIDCYRIVCWNAERTFARTLASTTTALPEDEANVRLMCAAHMMREESEHLYYAIDACFGDVSLDDESKEYLQEATDRLQEAWKLADGKTTEPTETDGNA